MFIVHCSLFTADPPFVHLQHPDYGLVSLANAKQIMERMDDPTTAAKADLDKTLNRLAQVLLRFPCLNSCCRPT